MSSLITLVTMNIMEKRGEMLIGCSGRLVKDVFSYPNIKKTLAKKLVISCFMLDSQRIIKWQHARKRPAI